jgi:hypothetical protein
MKIRFGFVSNSSSSSFLIVGTDNKSLIEKLLEKERNSIEDDNSGVANGDLVSFIGSDDDYHLAGMEIEGLLRKDFTLKELKQKFIERAKKSLDVDITEDDLDLHFGESYGN